MGLGSTPNTAKCGTETSGSEQSSNRCVLWPVLFLDTNLTPARAGQGGRARAGLAVAVGQPSASSVTWTRNAGSWCTHTAGRHDASFPDVN